MSDTALPVETLTPAEKPELIVITYNPDISFPEFVCAYMLHVLHAGNVRMRPMQTDLSEGLIVDGKNEQISVLYQIGHVIRVPPKGAKFVFSVAGKPGPAIVSLPYADMKADLYTTDSTKKHVGRHVIRQADSDLIAYASLPTLLQQAIFYVQNNIWVTTCTGGNLATAVLEGFAEDQRKSSLRSLMMVLDGLPEFASDEAKRFYELTLNSTRTFEAFDELFTNIKEFL